MTDEADRPVPPAAGEGETSLIGIGEAAAILDAEFGGVSISKIRFLESRGLVAPVRTRGGSRRYARADVDRLRVILTWQRRDFLPLDVIAERLADVTSISAEVAPAPGTPDDVRSQARGAEQVLRPRRTAELTKAEFLRRCLCPPEIVEQMRGFGLLQRYDSTGLEICEIVARLRDHGIEPRHLRWLGQAAEREVTLVRASVPTRSDAPAETVAEIDASQRSLAADLTGLLALRVRAALDEGG